ncbi:MAG TPA: hypothetical protein ENI95_08885 [Chloroflexi bacterium]|nr:hypothetical protein [Chloroflexota bacterium]
MSLKKAGLLLCGGGVLVLLFFVLADRLGVGRNPAIFGHHQLIGASVGMVLMVLGFALVLSHEPRAG